MIDISRISDGDPASFRVIVRDDDGSSRHEVTMAAATHKRLAPDHSAAQLMEAAFRFLLDREGKEAILGRFDLDVIPQYFPDFEKALPAYLEPI